MSDDENHTPVDWPDILRRHGSAVWRTIYRMLGEVEPARDCYQDTFLAALQATRRKPVENWSAFLQALATRRAIDVLRRRYLRREQMHLAHDAEEEAVDPAPPAPQLLERADLCQKVRLLLATLPQRQAQAFWMRFIEQIPVGEIARQLETAPGNVSVLLNRAAAHLREALNGCGSSHHHLGEARV